MITRTETPFAGHDCIRVENESISLWVMRSESLRVIGLALKGQANIFAELPEMTAEWPGVGTYRFRGGHRLWVAPEDPQRTYLPDDDAPNIREIDGGLLLTQPPAGRFPIRKTLAIGLDETKARVVVDHTLQNLGPVPVEVAPWAITQLMPGGVAVLPQATGPADMHGLLPNRHLVLWPYTRLDSSQIVWGDRTISIDVTMGEGALKLGFPNPSGWLAYIIDGMAFVKQAAFQPEADYYDRGSSSECYCCPRFVELETLGPRVTLAPGESTGHREVWTIASGVTLQDLPDRIEEILA